MHLPLNIAPPATHQIEIGFRPRNVNGTWVARRIDRQSVSGEVISQWNAIDWAILVHIRFFVISVTKLWDTMFSLCIWNCRTHHAKVLEFKSSYKMTNELDICLPISVMFERINRIRDKMYKQHWSEWCHTSDRRSGQCSILICLNDNCHAAFIHALNCITLHTNCVHIFAMFPIAYDRSWKSRRKS